MFYALFLGYSAAFLALAFAAGVAFAVAEVIVATGGTLPF